MSDQDKQKADLNKLTTAIISVLARLMVEFYLEFRARLKRDPRYDADVDQAIVNIGKGNQDDAQILFDLSNK